MGYLPSLFRYIRVETNTERPKTRLPRHSEQRQAPTELGSVQYHPVDLINLVSGYFQSLPLAHPSVFPSLCIGWLGNRRLY